MKLIFSLFLFLPVLIWGYSSAAEPNIQTTCKEFSAPITGEYCVHIPLRNASKDLIYHLHGRDGSAKSWSNPYHYTSLIQKEWSKKKRKFPTVVSISFGPVWLLANRNSSAVSGLFDLLVHQIIPSIEQELGGRSGKRIVLGESMGGFNSAQLALKTDLFDKAAILCAPMSEVSPFAPSAEVQAHVQKSLAYEYWKDSSPTLVLERTAQIIGLARAFFPTSEDFQSANPIELARTSNSKTDLYVSAAAYDEYVLYEGNEVFVKLLTDSNRRKVRWQPLWGAHCAMDIRSLAKFLID